MRKGDIIIAKNYLSQDELDSLNRLVNVFLESAELRVKDNKTLSMDFWKENVDLLLKFQGKEILKGNGSISNEQMEQIVKERYEAFNDKRKKIEAMESDKQDMQELENIYKKIDKNTKN